MKNGLVMALVLTAFLLGTVTLATAGTVTWTTLETTNPTGMGPGPDGVIGVPGCPGSADNDDTTTGEWNTWGGLVQFIAWGSMVATALITVGLYQFGIRGSEPTVG